MIDNGPVLLDIADGIARLRLNRPEKQYVEVILLSRNSADTGLRVFNAIKHYGLDISRAAFTKGEPTSRYVPAFGAHLFLSADTEDVKRVLDDGYAAATIVPSTVGKNETDDLRIAFDGDAVLFSDEAERVYQKSGLAAFSQSETDAALRPLSGCMRTIGWVTASGTRLRLSEPSSINFRALWRLW